jgi:uncharacterized membrane protein YkoI
MKTKTTSVLVLAAVSSVLAAGAAQASESAKHEAEALSNAKISLTDAIRADFDFKGGNPAYYEIKVLRDDGKKLTKYELDPNTGKIKEASDEQFEKLFTRIKPTSIQNAPTSLTRAISTAETRAGGKAEDATVDRDGDQLKYTVKVVKNDGTTEKVKINGSDGKVASAD